MGCDEHEFKEKDSCTYVDSEGFYGSWMENISEVDI